MVIIFIFSRLHLERWAPPVTTSRPLGPSQGPYPSTRDILSYCRVSLADWGCLRKAAYLLHVLGCDGGGQCQWESSYPSTFVPLCSSQLSTFWQPSLAASNPWHITVLGYSWDSKVSNGAYIPVSTCKWARIPGMRLSGIATMKEGTYWTVYCTYNLPIPSPRISQR